MKYEYDMIVLGGGAAGLVAAGMSSLLGARTALIEEHRLGGDCTWTGCIPSKSLLRVAHVAHEMRTADRYGLNAGDPRVNGASIFERVRQLREQVYDEADAPPNIEALGVEIVFERATFVDTHTVELSSKARLTSRYFVIATGSRPRIPPFNSSFLTNETVFELERLPERLLVLGAGPVGIEMAQAFRRLGSDVTVVSRGARILRHDDPELTAMLQRALEGEGIRFLLGRELARIEKRDSGVSASLNDGTSGDYDAVLAALGREATLEGLGLDRAGVAVENSAIRTDRHCRTSQKNIYACGDVAGKHQFTHMAEHMSKVAVTNALLHVPASVDERHIVWCTFTDPELATLGQSEDGARRSGISHTVYRFPYSKLDRAITEQRSAGLIKVVTGRGGRILGAAICGANAGEMIAEWAVAMKHGITIKGIADTIHAYPTYALGNRRAADEWYTRKLNSPLLGIVQKLFRYRGVRKNA